MRENTFICSHCGEVTPRDECCCLDEEELCATCAEENTVLCSHCHTRIWRDDTRTLYELDGTPHVRVDEYMKHRLQNKLIRAILKDSL